MTISEIFNLIFSGGSCYHPISPPTQNIVPRSLGWPYLCMITNVLSSSQMSFSLLNFVSIPRMVWSWGSSLFICYIIAGTIPSKDFTCHIHKQSYSWHYIGCGLLHWNMICLGGLPHSMCLHGLSKEKIALLPRLPYQAGRVTLPPPPQDHPSMHQNKTQEDKWPF